MAQGKAARRRSAASVEAPVGAWFDAWDRVGANRRHLVVLALLSVVAAWFMAPALFSGKVLVGSDITHWSSMARSVLQEEAATGHKPLWAVNPFGGMPAYMISYDHVVPQLDDVARWLRSFLWPASHLLILFAGMYGLVFFLTRERIAAALSAVGFGLTTYLPILLVAGHNSKYVTLAYVPWLLWAFAFALRRPSLLAGLLFAAATAVNLRAGHVQIVYYATFAMGVWWLVEAVDAGRNGRLASFGKATGWLALGGIAAVLMVAQPYLVQAEYKAFTIRGATSGGADGGMSWEYAMAWSQGPGELLTLLVADAFGGGGATYWGPKTFTAGPHYVGGVVLLLAVVALWRGRHRTVLALASAAVLMTLFALGENLAVLNRFMYDHFPLFSSFRVPETWLSVVTLLLAVLAGIGAVEAVRRDHDAEDDARRSKAVIAIAVAALVLMLGLVGFGTSLLDFEKPQEMERLAAQVAQQRPDLDLQDPQVARLLEQEVGRRKAERVDLFDGDARRTLAFVAAAALLLILARRRRLPAWAVQFVLVLLVAADLGGVGHRYFNEDALVPERQAEQPVPEYGFDRFLLERQAEAGGPGRFRVLSLEGDPSVSARPAYFYESLGGYHGAKLRGYQDYLDHILFEGGRGLPSPGALRIANVGYVAAGFALPGMQAVYADDQTGMTVFEVPDPRPRAWFVDEVEVLPEAEAQWARLTEEAFDPATTAVSGAAPGIPPAPRDSTSIVRVEQGEYRAEYMAFDVETDKPRVLVVSEVYYPAGWTARIDGEEAAVLPVNYLFRGIVVPQGAHRVEWAFDPPSHRIGVTVSAASTAVVYGLLVWLLAAGWRRRRASAPSND